MPESARQGNTLTVSPEEAGMKLLRFLERRLPQTSSRSALHKWIRTGQVRVNGGRAKAFALLEAGDAVRVPPFALTADSEQMNIGMPDVRPELSTPPPTLPGSTGLNGPLPLEFLAAEGIELAAATEKILVMIKPGGLAVQSGTGQGDSVAEKLKRAWGSYPYQPSPAHRLDRHTSGLLLAGLQHRAQQDLHMAFARGAITKDYLAWIAGIWPDSGPCLLLDSLHKATTRTSDGKDHELMQATEGSGQCLPLSAPTLTREYRSGESTAGEKEQMEGHAAAVALPVRFMSACSLHMKRVSFGVQPSSDKGHALPSSVPKIGATLMLVRLFTGRTHQIRVQLSSRGFPLIGDGRYGGPSFSRMLLHAWRMVIPADLAGMETTEQPAKEAVFSTLPPWLGRLMPEAHELEQALDTLQRALAKERSLLSRYIPPA